MGSTSLDDEGFTADGTQRSRGPPPVQPPAGEQGQRQAQPSVNVVEAAKPTYNITVGDPHKVGDLTTSHTEYQVYTKVTSDPPTASTMQELMCMHNYRPPPKHTAIPNSSSPAASATSSGSTTNSTKTIRASSSLLHPKNKHSTASTPISWNRAVKPSNAWSTRSPCTPLSNTTLI